MKRPTYTIGKCCDLHVTCEECCEHVHIVLRNGETIRQARFRALDDHKCMCEAPIALRSGA